MNDRNESQHDGLQALDERARVAVSDLQTRAEARPRPAFDPERLPVLDAPPAPAAHSRTRILLAVAAALVLVVGGVAWWSARPESGPGPVTSSNGGIRPFVATDLPDGFKLAGAGQYDRADGSSSNVDYGSDGALVMYGPDIAEPWLGVAQLKGFSTDDFEGAAERFSIGDRTAYAFDGKGLGIHTVILPSGSEATILTSPTLSRAELVRLAPLVTVDDGRPSLNEDDLPEGWQQVGEEPSMSSLTSPFGAMRSDAGPGRFTVYARSNVYAMISITVLEGDEARLYAPALVLGDPEQVTVNGHPGIMGTPQRGLGSEASGSEPVEGVFISWIDAPGELIRVTSYGIGRDELEKVAEAMKPAGPAEWKDLVERAQLGEFDTTSNEGTQELGSGTFESGIRWVLRLTPPDGAQSPAEASLSVSLTGDSSTGTTGQAAEIGADGKPVPGQPFTSAEVRSQNGHVFASGLLADDVAKVELRRTDGTVVGEATIVEALGYRGYAAEVTDGVTAAVALDANGKELGATDVRGDDGSGQSQSGSVSSPTTIVTGGAPTSTVPGN